MKFNKTLALATLSLAALSLMPSCQNEDFGFRVDEVKKSRFTKNFEAEYGAISPDQTWDLTRYQYRTAKYDDEELVDYVLQNGQTRADAGSPIGTLPSNTTIEIDAEGYYHVEANTIKWLRNYLKEGVNNTGLGSAFSLRSPGNQIAIIPIYQGFANMDWSLWIRRGTQDTQLWTESKDILVSNDGGSTWDGKGTTYGTSQTVYDQAIKSKPIVVDLQQGENFNLFLKIDKGLDNYATEGTIQLSSMGMMLALPCPLPTNLGTTGGKDNLAMIVGVEDSDLKNSDWDMNDVCFLIVGLPDLPNRIDLTRKRYMCEDLGNTYDFDFNDIVVDVMEVVTSEYNHDKNHFVPKGDPVQIATIKHVCGTLPFQVKVGNTTFNAVTDPTDEEQTRAELQKNADIVDLGTRAVGNNPEVSIKVTGWDHNTNNIEIVVSSTKKKSADVLADAFGEKNGTVIEDNGAHIYHITFPQDPGQTPLIIATDPTLQWMEEHVHIPAAWWQDGTFKPTGSADNDAPITPGGDGGNTDWKDIPESLVKLDADGNAVIWEGPETFNYYEGLQLQTNFLDAVFEGYTVLEVQLKDEKGNFLFRKVGIKEWEDITGVGSSVQYTDHKFVYSLTPDKIKELVLGIVLEADAGSVTIEKVVMKKPQSYTLTVNAGDHGTVSVSPAPTDGKYEEGTEVTITATPEDGWFFDQWSDGNKTNPRKVTISGNLTLTASFTDVDNSTQAEGNIDLNRTETALNNWSNSIEIAHNDFHEGDVIVVKVKDIGTDAEIGLKANWEEFDHETVNGDIAYTLTAANAQAINNANMLRVQGKNVTVISVTKRCSHTEPEEPTKPTSGTYTFGATDMNFDLDEWSYHVDIAKDQFSGIQNGDVIKVTFANTSGSATLKVPTGDWAEYQGLTKSLSTDGTITLTVSDANRQNLIDYGMAIQGEGVTFVKAELTKAQTEPETPTTEALSLTDLNTGWNSKYDASTHTITYEAAWAGRGWWLDTKDCREFNSVVVEFDQALTTSCKLIVEYAEGSSEQEVDSGATSVKCSLDNDKKSSVKQIYLHNSDANAVYVLKNAYLTTE